MLLIGVLLLVIVVMSVASPYFLSWKNCRNILNQSAIYLVLSVGMTFVISMGEIDLSVGAIMGFAGMSMGMLYKSGIPAGAAIVLGLIVAAVIGGINGAIVAYGKINSFIVTLGTMTILRAFILILTNSKSIFGFGKMFNFIGSGRIGHINAPILISLVIALIGAIVLHKTIFGNYCLFCGTNAVALNRSGVDVKKNKMLIFTVCGFCAGIAGLIVTARLNSAEPLAGQGYDPRGDKHNSAGESFRGVSGGRRQSGRDSRCSVPQGSVRQAGQGEVLSRRHHPPRAVLPRVHRCI